MTARVRVGAQVGSHEGLTWRGIPVVLPSARDPRLHVSAVIMSLQVLGQVAFAFKVSIAQILITIGACALVEVAVILWKDRALVWPASALLTGNGVAFILRASGTDHGDWWSLNGIEFFLLAGVGGLLSKYVLRIGKRHLYNPSNLGLVATLLIVGPGWVFPQYLFWGDLTPPLVAALALIVLGAILILRPLKMLPMTVSFLIPFTAFVALLAASGRCMHAVWHNGPICGVDYWYYISTSPELFIFVFYMMSDPKTAPQSPRARIVYGPITALIAGTLIAFQPTEYGVKVALLASLTMVCSVVPLIDRVCEGLRARLKDTPPLEAASRPDRPLLRHVIANPILVAFAVVLIAVPVAVGDLAGNRQLLDLERGIAPGGGPAVQ
jgi:hypothetical protein